VIFVSDHGAKFYNWRSVVVTFLARGAFCEHFLSEMLPRRLSRLSESIAHMFLVGYWLGGLPADF